MYILHVKCHLPYKSACVYFDTVRACYMYILHVKCHLPYKSACVYFDSHGGRGCRNLVAKGSEFLIIVNAVLVSLLEHVTCTSFMSNVIFLIYLPVCTLIATGGGGAGIW